MAWSVLKEGWTSEWDKIYITVKYETARSGTQAGIRYRIEYIQIWLAQLPVFVHL